MILDKQQTFGIGVTIQLNPVQFGYIEMSVHTLVQAILHICAFRLRSFVNVNWIWGNFERKFSFSSFFKSDGFT